MTTAQLAVSGEATHIVTGDEDLLRLDPFRGIMIYSPDQFVASFQLRHERRTGPMR